MVLNTMLNVDLYLVVVAKEELRSLRTVVNPRKVEVGVAEEPNGVTVKSFINKN